MATQIIDLNGKKYPMKKKPKIPQVPKPTPAPKPPKKDGSVLAICLQDK